VNATVTILGLDFFRGSVDEAVEAALRGGLLVAPSAPGLATLDTDHTYRDALLAADLRLVDSGLLAFLWEIHHRSRAISRISGYIFLKKLLSHPTLAEPGTSLWVAPSQQSATRTREWLASNCSITTGERDWYVAPSYDNAAVADDPLLSLIRSRKPRFIFIGVGGGPQEKLGAWLKQRLDYHPTILCTGAAIAFMTGEQAHMPDWVDRARLGWLARALQNPRRFVPRYLQAFRLIPLYRRWGDKLPIVS